MNGLARDVRHALRRVVREPGMTGVMVVTMAVAIAANAAIFGAVRPVVAPDLPFPEADRVIRVWERDVGAGNPRGGVSWQDARDWAASSESFQHLAVYVEWEGNLRAGQEPLRIQYALAEPGFFRVLGVAPLRGRTLLPDEIQPDRGDVVVLSHGLWTRAFGADRGIIGRVVQLAGRPVEVVGVMPPEFTYPSRNTDAWKPFGMAPDDGGRRDSYWVSAIGRLTPAATLASAREELEAIGRNLEAAYPATNQGVRPYLESLPDVAVLGARAGVGMLWGAVGLLLLVACANVATLLLARGRVRTGELAVRTALGADRAVLLRQLLVESLVTAGLGGALGLTLAVPATRGVETLVGNGLSYGLGVKMDLAVIGYTLLVTAFAGIAFGLLPALRGSREGIAAVRGARGTAGRRVGRLGLGLVAGQTALAVVIMVGAGLLGRSLTGLSGVDPGYDVEAGLTFRVAPPWEGTDRPEAAVLFRRIRDRVAAVPGVRSVAAVNRLPLPTRSWVATWTDQRRVDEPGLVAFSRVVQPGFLETLGVPLLRGRALHPTDHATSEPVAVVSETAAREYWPEGDAIGSYLSLAPDNDQAPWVRVVGVVADVEVAELDGRGDAVVYTPFEQSVFGHFGDWGMDFLVRTAGDPAPLAATIRRTVAEVDASLPAFGVSSLKAAVAGQLDDTRALGILMGLFALTALFLAALGVYGTLAYDVARRVPEIGVRMALGARARTVLGGVLRRGLLVAGAGLAVGLVAAAFGSRWIEGLLFGVDPVDPATYVVIGITLLAVAASAAGLPAWRAARIDPARALRQE